MIYYSIHLMVHLTPDQEWCHLLSASTSLNVTDVTPLAGCTALMELNLHETEVTDISPCLWLTVWDILDVLKELRLSSYYDNKQLILTLLTNRKPPQLTVEQENQIKSKFMQMQAAFEIVCPVTRKNFLSYSYALHKILELMELHELKSHFPLLKGFANLMKQDKIWKDLCKILGWRFWPSV